jgi:hypothetical protein
MPSDVLYGEIFLSMLVNALVTADRYRRDAGAPEAEYALDVEIDGPGRSVQMRRIGGDSRRSMNVPEIRPLPLQFPRRSVGTTDEFDRLVTLVLRDLYNAAGLEFQQEVQLYFSGVDTQ